MVDDVKASAPSGPPKVIPDREITLPISGTVVKISGRALTGNDRINTMRHVNEDMGMYVAGVVIVYQSIASVTSIDGRQLVYEDVRDMDTRDSDALKEALESDPRFPQLADAGKKKGALVPQTPPGPSLH
jgi:hypothetical protein